MLVRYIEITRPYRFLLPTPRSLRATYLPIALHASGGAAVSCIGRGDERVRQAVASQLAKLD